MEEVKNEIAVNYGFKDWQDLWVNGDITLNIIDDLMLLFGIRSIVESCRNEIELANKTK